MTHQGWTYQVFYADGINDAQNLPNDAQMIEWVESQNADAEVPDDVIVKITETATDRVVWTKK